MQTNQPEPGALATKRWRAFSVPAALILCVLVGAALGSGVYTVQYAEGLSYLSDNPQACVNCHVMREQHEGWQKASHHAVATCNDCHLPHGTVPKYIMKAENGFWHSKGFTFQDFHEPIRLRPISAKILQKNCIRCHHDLVNDTLGDGVHGNETLNCVHCHAVVGHGPQR